MGDGFSLLRRLDFFGCGGFLSGGYGLLDAAVFISFFERSSDPAGFFGFSGFFSGNSGLFDAVELSEGDIFPGHDQRVGGIMGRLNRYKM